MPLTSLRADGQTMHLDVKLPATVVLTIANIPSPDPGVVPLPPMPLPSEPPSQAPPPIQDPAVPGEHEPVREPSTSAPLSKRH